MKNNHDDVMECNKLTCRRERDLYHRVMNYGSQVLFFQKTGIPLCGQLRISCQLLVIKINIVHTETRTIAIPHFKDIEERPNKISPCRIVMIKNVLEGSEVGFLKGITGFN
ncbi:hypothetical protein LXL04_036421 [Taraxacum kok-saghyz]